MVEGIWHRTGTPSTAFRSDDMATLAVEELAIRRRIEEVGSAVTNGNVRVTGISLGLAQFDELEAVGRGAHSVVYRSFVSAHDRFVAVKVLSGEWTDTAQFDREARALAALSDHPNIVTLHQAGTTSLGQPFLVMDYWPDGSYGDLLTRSGPIDIPELLDAGIRLAGALSAAHSAGIRHRDIKPENILITAGGPALCDFGIAGFGEQTATTRPVLDLRHVAPESPVHRKESDLYSLSSTLYELVEGHPPLAQTADPMAMMERLRRYPPEPMSPRVPSELQAVLLGALAKDPDSRQPRQASDFGVALQRVQVRLGLTVTPLVAPGVASHPVADLSVPDDATTIGLPRSTRRVGTPDENPPSDTPGRSGGGVIAARIIIATLIAVLAGLLVVNLKSDKGNPDPTQDQVTEVAIAPPTTLVAGQADPAPASQPGAPTNLKATWTAQARVELTWQDRSSVENGFVVQLAMFALDSDGKPIPTPQRKAFLGADGLRESADGLRALPPNSESVVLHIEDLDVYTCLRVIATASSGVTPATDQLCLPDPPAAATWDLLPVQNTSSGPLTLTWRDNSLNESGFNVYEVDFATGEVLTIQALPADSTTLTWPGELLHGERRCFTLTARNAAQLVPTAKGSPLKLPEGSFSTACFDVVGGTG